jgi:hypothetical protein
LDGLYDKEAISRLGRIRECVLLGEARTGFVIAHPELDLDDLRGGRDGFGVDLLEAVDVAEDAAQLFGVEVLLTGLETKAREHRDMAHFFLREGHPPSLAGAPPAVGTAPGCVAMVATSTPA